MIAPLAADSLVIGQGSAVTLDGRLRRRPRRQPVAVRQLGQRRARRFRRQPRGAVHALRPGDPRSARARHERSLRRLLLPEGRAALKGYLAGGRVVFHRRARLRHPRSRALREVARHEAGHRGRRGGLGRRARARGGRGAGDPRPAREPAERLRPARRALRQREAPARSGRTHRLLADGQLPPAQEPPARRAMRSRTDCRGKRGLPRSPPARPRFSASALRADASRRDRRPTSCSGAATRSR